MSTTAAGAAVIRIEPPRGLRGLGFELGELWRYRPLTWMLLVREIKARHRVTAVGPLWFILNPIMQIVVFSLILGRVLKAPSEGYPYAIFIGSAMLGWDLFTASINSATSSLPTYLPWMSKVYFPRLIAPLVFVLAAAFDWLFSALVIVGLMAWYAIPLTTNALWLPLYMGLAVLAGLSAGLFFAPLAAWFRDVPRFLGYLLNVLKWLTPVMYSATVIEADPGLARYRWLYELNPVYWVAQGCRWSLLPAIDGRVVGKPPDAAMLAPAGGCLVLLILGIAFYSRAVKNVADISTAG